MAGDGARTVADIARHLALSPGTVSKALNNRRDVSEATRLRVLDAARRLNYRVGGHGRYNVGEIAIRRIGLICFAAKRELLLTDSVHGQVIHAIERESAAGGEELIFEFGVKGLPRCYQAGRIDGAIAIGDVSATQQVEKLDGVPVVCTPDPVGSVRVDCVCQDNAGGAEQITRLLLEQGHRRIAFVAHNADRRPFVERAAGYALGMRQAGAEPQFVTDPMWVGECGEVLAAGVKEADVTAVVAVNDSLGTYLVRRLGAEGVRVPEDLSVVGFDHKPWHDAWEDPAHQIQLTTVDGQLEEVGRQAVRLLRRRMDGPAAAPLRIVVAPRIVSGDSVGEPSTGRPVTEPQPAAVGP